MITWSIEDRKELKIPVSTNADEKSMRINYNHDPAIL